MERRTAGRRTGSAGPCRTKKMNTTSTPCRIMLRVLRYMPLITGSISELIGAHIISAESKLMILVELAEPAGHCEHDMTLNRGLIARFRPAPWSAAATSPVCSSPAAQFALPMPLLHAFFVPQNIRCSRPCVRAAPRNPCTAIAMVTTVNARIMPAPRSSHGLRHAQMPRAAPPMPTATPSHR